MLEDGYFQHESKNGSPFFERVKTFYRADGYDTLGRRREPPLQHRRHPRRRFRDRRVARLAAHRDNMLASSWREVGIGALHAAAAGGTFGGDPTWIVTMDFGARTGGKARQLAVKPKPKKARKATRGSTSLPSRRSSACCRCLRPAASRTTDNRRSQTPPRGHRVNVDEPDLGFEPDAGFDLTR